MTASSITATTRDPILVAAAAVGAITGIAVISSSRNRAAGPERQ